MPRLTVKEHNFAEAEKRRAVEEARKEANTEPEPVEAEEDQDDPIPAT